MARKRIIPGQFRTQERKDKVRAVLEKRQFDFTVVFENINDPHNLSAVLRSCDAVGIYEVCLVYYGKQEMPELNLKSSASAAKWVNLRVFDSIAECYAALRAENKKIYTTHMAKDSVSLYDLDLCEPHALVFGNEHDGVSEEAVSLADGNFLIPQVGMIQSLNISVAYAVSVYEAYRQRLQKGYYDKPILPEEKIAELTDEWLIK